MGDFSDDDDFEIERSTALVDTPPTPSTRDGKVGPASAGRIPVAPVASARASNPGLELAYRRPDAKPEAAQSRAEPSTGLRVAAYAIAAVTSGAATAGLMKLAHRTGGRNLTALLPHAFDATSMPQSGGCALTLLALAIVLGWLGFRHPRSWAFVASGGAALLASLAMVTVTLVASEEHPSPADGARLIPYVVPLGIALFALGLVGRAARAFLDNAPSRPTGAQIVASLGIALTAGAIFFAAVETFAH